MTWCKSTGKRGAALFAPVIMMLAMGAAAQGAESAARKPVLLELFTSEGCSSCPPADALLEKLDATQPVDGADLIVLSEHVDYWNNGGWEDPFSSHIFSVRQQEYTAHFSVEGPYTPELVVDGRAELVGSNAPKAQAAIEEALGRPKLEVTLTHAERDGKAVRAHIQVAGGPGAPSTAGGATVYVVVAQNEAESGVGAGENAGKKLHYVAVVQTLQGAGKLGATGDYSRDVTVSLGEAGKKPVRLVAFVQDKKTRAILGAAQVRL